LFINRNTVDLPYNATEQWKTILPYLVQYPEKPGFDIALYNMIDTMTWDFGFKEIWTKPTAIFQTIVRRYDQQLTELAFYFLLEGLTGNTYCDSKALWKIFFETVTPAEREIYGKIIAANIESITYRKNAKKLPNDIIRDYIWPDIGKISDIIELFAKSTFDIGDNGMQTFAFIVNALVNTAALRTWPMYNDCRVWARNNKSFFNEEEFKAVEDFSEKFFKTEGAQANATEQRNIDYFKHYIT
jgi:hypothetical protein